MSGAAQKTRPGAEISGPQTVQAAAYLSMSIPRRKAWCWGGSLAVVLGLMLEALPAAAGESTDGEHVAPAALEAKDEAPITAYAYTAHGSSKGIVGAQGYGSTLAGKGQKATAGGGVLVWAAPIERLTLVLDAPRDIYLEGHFAPSVAGIVRLMGGPRGFSLGAIGKYKVEGFGTDPNGEMEHEIEAGILLSYVEAGWHLDLNGITGFGLTEDGEIDTEGRFRLGYDLGSLVRVGLDAQARFRLAGEKNLLNGSSADFAAGGQLMVGTGQLYASLTAGPATMGLSTSGVVGATAILSIAGAM